VVVIPFTRDPKNRLTAKMLMPFAAAPPRSPGAEVGGKSQRVFA
jgi:hypothetical protein